MANSNYYETLDISPSATTAEIKQAYRRLAKLFHPDSNSDISNHEKIIQINAAYEVLSDPDKRRSYDTHIFHRSTQKHQQWQQPVAQNVYKQRRRNAKNEDEQLDYWLKQVYVPVNRLIYQILNPLGEQIDQLAADPFDDELMEAFQTYLQECRQYLNQAQVIFRSLPNPAIVAGAAVNLYYCLNQLADGIEDLNMFTQNYDDHYLHTGQELFRIATCLRWEAHDTLKNIT